MNVRTLELRLLERFPAEDAESWDFTGLMVGDPAAPVTGVAVALDQTVEAVRQAAQAGASVLVTHHPTFLSAPSRVMPASAGVPGPGSVVWEAVRSGVALMNFHTALDVSPAAQAMLPGKLGLELTGVLQPLPDRPNKGYGHVCTAPQGMTLRMLAQACAEKLGRPPRVWGDPETLLESVVCATGSAGHLGEDCLKAGIDCLLCGELKYHGSLDLAQAGLAIVELGHDVSELPLTEPLMKAVQDAGVPAEDVIMIDQSRNWACWS
ncbi:MAG: Nif3-like dinuclear metal center hexameric protein [Coriobacteriia bacterium]|nr:Nif3-like dinuclear metal center hexameric protein [Coriobacteriia bacterium]